jgi:hypothetical protein
MNTRDWRTAPATDIRPLFDDERSRWQEQLSWDMTPTLALLESSRLRGDVPGLIAYENGTPAGWAFYVPYDGVLQIGALSGHNTAVVRQLLDEVMDSPEAGLTQSVSCFVHPASPAVSSAFARRRFDVARQLYLSRDLTEDDLAEPTGPADATIVCGGWRADDAADCVRLLSRAYAGTRAGTCFAPKGRIDQWVHYLRQLLTTPTCGVVLPAASRILRGGSPRQPIGFVLTTTIAAGTAHIAQLVIEPSWRGQRLGERLLRAAFRSAREAGQERVTLIVDEGNAAAVALYKRVGFKYLSEFVYASRPMPTRKRLKAA